MFQKGAIVEVFEDPFTMTRKEGTAVIIAHVQNLEPDVDLYKVNFIGDAPDSFVVRKIALVPLCCCTDPVYPDNPNCRVHGSGGVS